MPYPHQDQDIMAISMVGTIFHGAHIGAGNRQTTSQETTKLPSIFDYLAEDALKASLKPGVHAALKFFGQFFPQSSAFLNRRFDELFLFFHAILENYYLRKFSGSFAENFYGLKRVLLINGIGASFSSLNHRIRSLITLVLLPYLADKCEKYYDRLKNDTQMVPAGWRHYFLRIFPRIKALLLYAFLLFQICYTFSLLSIPSPLLLLAKCRLERLTAEDIFRIQSSGQTPLHMQKGSILSFIWRLFLRLPSVLGRFLSYGLFLLQFLEYFYTDELGRRFGQMISGEQSRFQEYPIHTLPDEQQVLCMEVNKCPLCKRTRNNDTVLSVSGYVFCHPCIYNFVSLEGRCPVTSVPASVTELVKLYH